LIRDGASLVLNVDDVLKTLGPLLQPVQNPAGGEIRSPRELTLNPQELEVLNLISVEPTPIDEVLRATQLDSSRVLATLTVLEMKRMVRRLPGGSVVRTSH
jgi:DNA processing protein